MFNPDGTMMAQGYSGAETIGKNNPKMEHLHNVGPIPVGFYTIGEAFDGSSHGPCVMRLTPDANNQMFGRDGFLIHGDLISNPGNASQGCIIMPKFVREAISTSDDKRLEVKADFVVSTET